MSKIAERYFGLIAIAVLLVAGFNLFLFLGKTSVGDWDEARHGITAYEMLQSGNFILATYLENPDYWNLKPPLGPWMTAAAFKLFGYSVFSLRFFSAFLSLLSVFLTLLLARKHFGALTAVLSGLVLSTTTGFVLLHSGRTGDFDSAFTFLTVASIYCLDRMDERPVFFYLSGLTASLGFLIKSFAAIPITLIVLLFLFLSKRFTVLKIRQYVLWGACCLTPPVLWVLARYREDGFIFFETMVRYDLLRRVSTGIEGHSGDHLFYLISLLVASSPWCLLALILLVAVQVWRARSACLKADTPTAGSGEVGLQKEVSPGNLILWVWLLTPLVLFSLASTKLAWYINPIYPPLAILMASFFIGLLENQPISAPWRPLTKVALAAALVLVAGKAEVDIFRSIVREARMPKEVQTLLQGLPGNFAKTEAELYLCGEPRQSIVFTAKVLKGLRLRGLEPEEFSRLRRLHARDLVAVELKTRERLRRTREQFVEGAKPGDLILIENSDENRLFLKGHQTELLKQGAGWALGVKVPG